MSKVLSGSKASLKLNGVKVAYVSGLSINQEDGLQPIDVLDQLEVAEHAETSHVVSFSANYFKVDENSMIALGIETNDINDVLSQPEMTMEVYDRIGDKVIYGLEGVKKSGGTASLEARGVWSGTINFVARKRVAGSL